MAPNFSPQSPMQPLSIGNVVSAAFRLYRSHLKSYLGIALIANLWQIVPIAILIPLLLLFIFGRASYSNLWLVLPVWFGFFLYCCAKSITNCAVISRLAFGELVNQPESVKDARDRLDPRKWTFLVASFLVSILSFVFLIALYITVAIIIGLAAVILGVSFGGLNQQNPGAIVILVLLGILVGIVFFGAIIWFLSRVFIYDVPLAVENDIGAGKTIGRSWELTAGNVFRIALIATVAFLLTIPLQIPPQIAASVIQGIIAKYIAEGTPPFWVITVLFSYLLGLVGEIVLTPFWQAIKAVLYYDLRSRREGMGLQLRDRTI